MTVMDIDGGVMQLAKNHETIMLMKERGFLLPRLLVLLISPFTASCIYTVL